MPASQPQSLSLFGGVANVSPKSKGAHGSRYQALFGSEEVTDCHEEEVDDPPAAVAKEAPSGWGDPAMGIASDAPDGGGAKWGDTGGGGGWGDQGAPAVSDTVEGGGGWGVNDGWGDASAEVDAGRWDKRSDHGRQVDSNGDASGGGGWEEDPAADADGWTVAGGRNTSARRPAAPVAKPWRGVFKWSEVVDSQLVARPGERDAPFATNTVELDDDGWEKPPQELLQVGVD